MNIIQFQELLGMLFRTTYKGDTVIQLNLLELGRAVERLLENRLISPFDDYEENKQKIFDEMRQIKL